MSEEQTIDPEAFLNELRVMGQAALENSSKEWKYRLLLKLSDSEGSLAVVIAQLDESEQACVSGLAQLVLLEDLNLRGDTLLAPLLSLLLTQINWVSNFKMTFS